MARELVLSGATGLIGRRLLPRLLREGYRVRALTRRPERSGLPEGATAIGWDGQRIPATALAGAEAVIHLAGEPLFAGPLTRGRKRRIFHSRVDSTRSLVEALAALPDSDRPEVLLCASAVGFYASAGDRILDEDGAGAKGFLGELCAAWEAAAQSARGLGLRVASFRIGMVLAREGGALALLRRPFALGLGGPLGNGEQWMPWVHVDDVVELLATALGDPRYSGVFNATAPDPVRNRDFAHALAGALGRRARFRVPAGLLRLALGSLSEELLASRRVLPARATATGFRFARDRLDDCLAAELPGPRRP